MSVLSAAVLFGASPPLAKILLRRTEPTVLAGLLYLGAFLGLTAYALVRRAVVRGRAAGAPLRGRDWPWLAGAVAAGGVAAPILLLLGLSRISGFSAALLLNLEAAFTALLAVLFFKEQAGRAVWAALALMTAGGVFLTWDPRSGGFAWAGAGLIAASMAAWGLDNNLTRAISDKDPVRIAQIKGLCAGGFSLGLSAGLGLSLPRGWTLAAGLALGALSYGASLVFYIRGLAGLGAFRAGALFSLAPLAGAAGALLLLRETLAWSMLPGLALVLAGTALIIGEKHGHHHRHGRCTHEHAHRHDDGHHAHAHGEGSSQPHSHEHTHEETDHVHVHWPDIHHRHGH